MTLARLAARILQNSAIAAVSTLAVGVLTARWLGAEGRGYYTLFFTTVGLLGTIGQSGFYQAAVYHIGRHAMAPAVALGNAVLLIGASGFALFGLYGLTVFFAPGILGTPLGSVIGVPLILGVLFQIVRESLGGIAMGMRKYNAYSEQLAIEPVFALIATMPLVFFLLDAEAAIELRVASAFFALLVLVWRVRGLLPERPIFRLRALLDEIAFGSKSTAQNVIGLMNYRVYVYFLALDPAAVGLFSVGMLFNELIRFLPNTLGMALLPILTGTKIEEAARLTAKACRVVLAATAILVTLLSALREPIVENVFGREFLPVTDILVPMLAGAVIGIVYQILTRYFSSVGLQMYSVQAGFAGLAVALAGSAILVPAFGLTGAAVAYLLSSVCTTLVMLTAFLRRSGLPARDVLFVTRSDIRQLAQRIPHIRR